MNACCYTAIVEAARILAMAPKEHRTSTNEKAAEFLEGEFDRWMLHEGPLEGDHGHESEIEGEQVEGDDADPE